MIAFALVLGRPWGFAVACALGAAAAVLVWRRRPAVGAVTLLCAGIGLLGLALGAGELAWKRPASAEVVVMVDLSASTRGAGYRERARLEQRTRELLGDTPYRTVFFSDRVVNNVEGAVLGDLAGEQTVYAPPAAIAVLLFSDGRFELPAHAPPTFVVADPQLDRTGDGSVRRLELRRDDIAATVGNEGTQRRLTIDAATTQPTVNIERGTQTIVRPVRRDGDAARAVLSGDDRWPENDALSLPLARPLRSQRWFVSNSTAPPGDWVLRRPAELESRNSAAYLGASVIVLDNLAVSQLSAAQLAGIEQYVRDLGGALIIGGGDQAFAQGMYEGTTLETLSPLASSPPLPTVHWLLLVDSSGSMSAEVGAQTRWQLASGAVSRLVAALPPADPVSVGSFAKELKWWSTGQAARRTALLQLPPASIMPNGPTNLEAALDQVAKQTDGAIPGELLVVSDADVVIDQPGRIVEALKAKRIRLHILAIGAGRGMETLRNMAGQTGGTLRTELDPARWASQTRQLLKEALPQRLSESPIQLRFEAPLSNLGTRSTTPWNRTWLKKDATQLAQGKDGATDVPLAGRWNLGSGEVVACGFSPRVEEWEKLAALVARPPRDPRFAIRWESAERLKVSVDATRDGAAWNGLEMDVEVVGEDGASPAARKVPQTAPGRYELSLPSPRQRGFATLRQAGRVLDRIPVAARYAPEFDAVGNDYEAMRALAQRTGGQVVDSSMHRALDVPVPHREVALSHWMGLAGAILVMLALAWWRIG